jgi:site-specific DNA-adenine methylase
MLDTMPKRFFGQTRMARQTAEYFPKGFKTYIEPFAGKAKNAEYAGDVKVHLNDLSTWSVKYCKENYPEAKVTQEDYATIINQYKYDPDAFILLDPPWIKIVEYTFTEKKVQDYYDKIIKLLDGCKCKWMLLGAANYNNNRPKEQSSLALKALESKFPNTVIFNDRGHILRSTPIGVRFIKNY